MSEITTTLTGFSAATIEKKRAVDAVQEGAQSTTGTAEYTFDVSNMDLFYDEYQALKDINMKIRKNEITALIGPSGCGKSTALDLLAMILPPSGAETFLFNAPGDTPEDVAELWRRRVFTT